MITGVHAIVFASDAEKARAFFRDVLAHVEVPGIGRLGLYEPRHPSPL